MHNKYVPAAKLLQQRFCRLVVKAVVEIQVGRGGAGHPGTTAFQGVVGDVKVQRDSGLLPNRAHQL